jgi:prepilin-type N-terminal cleavage/methylation domain-containing protein
MKSSLAPLISGARRARGFTLIELLVVIMIIGILAGVSYAALGAVKKTALKTKARSDVNQIAAAIGNYFMEYNKYPIPGGGDSDSDIETDQAFMSILMGFDPEMNPRGTSYIEPKAANNGVSGMISPGGGPGDLVDPWGKRFKVKMDGNYDKEVDNPNPSGDNRTLYQRVLVWSTGPDREEDSTQAIGGDLWRDNLTNW